MTPLLSEYFDLLEKHEKDFKNEHVLLLMQVGSFYEAYEIDEPKRRGCAKLISDVLRMHLTKKNGNKGVAENNPWMVGFPTYVLGKHLARLNDEGFTVAVYDQKAENRQERELKGIYNYIMRHENEDEVISVVTDRRIFGLLVEKYKNGSGRVKNYRYLISMCYVDMTNGYIGVHEQDSEDYHREIQNILLHYSPPEILIRFDGFSEQDKKQTIESLNSCRVVLCEDDLPTSQILGLLQDIYETKDDPLVYLGLERHASLSIVLSMVLQNIKKHDPILATKLQKPCFVNNLGRYLEYNRDAFLELNIASICERRRSYVQTNKQKSLLDILSHGMSLLGKRRLEGLLRRPLLDAKEILERQTSIEYFQKEMESYKEPIRVPDLEWMMLKWKRERLSFRLTGQFLMALQDIYHVTSTAFPVFWQDDKYKHLLEEIEQWFDYDKMCAEDLDFIKVSTHELKDFEKQQGLLQHELNKIEEQFKEYFKLQSSSEGSWFLTCSVKKWETYQYKNLKNELYEIQKNKSVVRVSFEQLDKISNKLQYLNQEKSSYVLASFRSISKEILEKQEAPLLEMIQKIGEMDCLLCLARFFTKHCYRKPTLLQESASKIVVEELRHPIHEYIEKDSLFVPYSFGIGGDDTQKLPLGMLLYGMNSSGKSTLLKSLGMAIWLAQCGFFVPVKSLEWTCLNGLFTKIGSYDNLFCGHSTFVAEMSELNYILRKSNDKTLVLCDELTSGTETRSATGIVASTLTHLVDNSILFLFTTHLHTVSSIPEIKDNTKIRICHFKVSSENPQASYLIDDIKIRYDRELNDGSGSDLYGIEIARSLGMSESFITKAFDFRERVELFIHDSETTYKTSRYNKNVIMQECNKCQSKVNLHTHHITPQAIFEKNPTFHDKNGKYNLMVLCEKCHEDVHKKIQKSLV
jgi:DNA mismatch repair protein MutS